MKNRLLNSRVSNLVTNDIDDANSDLMIITDENLAVNPVSYKYILQRYKGPTTFIWTVKEVCYNAENEVVYIKLIKEVEQTAPPSEYYPGGIDDNGTNPGFLGQSVFL